jgi:hypothetical protein
MMPLDASTHAELDQVKAMVRDDLNTLAESMGLSDIGMAAAMLDLTSALAEDGELPSGQFRAGTMRMIGTLAFLGMSWYLEDSCAGAEPSTGEGAAYPEP